MRRHLDHVDDYLCIALVVLMTVVVSMQVFSRYVLNSSLYWSEEVARIALTWLTFLGASAVMKRGGHVGLENIVVLLPPRPRFLALLLSAAGVAVFASVVVWAGVAFTRQGANQITPATEISVALVYAALPIGGGLMLIRAVANLIDVSRSRSDRTREHNSGLNAEERSQL